MRALAFVSPYAAVPPRYGGPLRVFNLCTRLASHFSVQQFAQQVTRNDVAVSLRPVVRNVVDGYVEYASRDPLSIALYSLTSLALNCPPFWQSWVLGLRAPSWLKRNLRAADIIHVEQPWQFRWVWEEIGGAKPVVLGSQNVEADLWRDQRGRLPVLLGDGIYDAIVALESFGMTHASMVLAVTARDAERLVARYGLTPDRVRVIPNGVDCSRFVPPPEEAREARKAELGIGGRTVVLFSGSLHYPNVEAARWIARTAQNRPWDGVCFLIVGTVGEALPSGYGDFLKVTGRVSDPRPFFEAADLAINPMITGGGSNLKQLEFMAMGLPTVATETGVRGVRFLHGIHGLVASLDEMPLALETLVGQREVRASMGAAARRLVQAEYDWSGIVRSLVQIYDATLDEAEAGSAPRKERPGGATAARSRTEA